MTFLLQHPIPYKCTLAGKPTPSTAIVIAWNKREASDAKKDDRASHVLLVFPKRAAGDSA